MGPGPGPGALAVTPFSGTSFPGVRFRSRSDHARAPPHRRPPPPRHALRLPEARRRERPGARAGAGARRRARRARGGARGRTQCPAFREGGAARGVRREVPRRAGRGRGAPRGGRAAADLQGLLTEYPLYRRAVEAKYLLALVDLDLGRERDGLATLGSLYAKLPADARPEAAARAADAALSLGADADAVRWLSELARISPPEARAGDRKSVV